VFLNIVCFVAIGETAERFAEEQVANVSGCTQRFVDRQALRRTLNDATARLESDSR
jgi:hypothetical protein